MQSHLSLHHCGGRITQSMWPAAAPSLSDKQIVVRLVQFENDPAAANDIMKLFAFWLASYGTAAMARRQLVSALRLKSALWWGHEERLSPSWRAITSVWLHRLSHMISLDLPVRKQAVLLNSCHRRRVCRAKARDIHVKEANAIAGPRVASFSAVGKK